MTSAATLLLVFDWNWLRGPLEQRLARSTGRDVAIGAVDGQWQRGPRLVLRDVAVGQADAPGAPLFRAETVYFEVTPAPLLRGELRLTEVGLIRARIYLHRDKDGRANWAAASTGAGSMQREEREPLWKRIHIGTLELDDVVLTLRDEKHQDEHPPGLWFQGLRRRCRLPTDGHDPGCSTQSIFIILNRSQKHLVFPL